MSEDKLLKLKEKCNVSKGHFHECGCGTCKYRVEAYKQVIKWIDELIENKELSNAYREDEEEDKI